MKVLLINGSPHEMGCTYTALSLVAKVLEEKGVETEIFHIGNGSVGGCTVCGFCSQNDKCSIRDSVNSALDKIKEADGFVFGSPVYYSSPNGSMVGFMDRLFRVGEKDLKHKPAAVVVSTRRAGSTATIEVLNKYPTYNEMPLINGDYWPGVHGNTPEEVTQDLEGVYTMKKLGENMAWILKCIELGKKAGAIPPETEKSIWTNFIK